MNLQTYNDVELFVRNNDENNILYTKAINEGLRKYAFNDSKFVLVLTQDAYMERNCLERLLASMIRNPSLGIACPVQKVQGRVTWGGSAQAWPGGVHTHTPEADGPFRTYWANGACMLLRTEMVKEIGLMDENMRFICSDSDYSFTARSRGWHVAVVPDAQAEHELDGSGSFGKNAWLDEIKLNDMIYFTNKWLSGDLFRSLSFNSGFGLSNTKIRTQLQTWENMRRKLSGSDRPALSSELLHESDLLDMSQAPISDR